MTAMWFVYLVEEIPYSAGESGPWTKIGRSINPAARLDNDMKRGNPRELRLAAVYAFDSDAAACQAEATAHRIFGQFRHPKEWFRVSWSQIADWAEKRSWLATAFEMIRDREFVKLGHYPIRRGFDCN